MHEEVTENNIEKMDGNSQQNPTIVLEKLFPLQFIKIKFFATTFSQHLKYRVF